MVRKKCYGCLSQFAATKGPLMRNHLIWIDLVQINHGLKNESDACQELGIMVTQEHRCLVLGSKQAGVYSGNSGWPLRALFNPNFQNFNHQIPNPLGTTHHGKVDPETHPRPTSNIDKNHDLQWSFTDATHLIYYNPIRTLFPLTWWRLVIRFGKQTSTSGWGTGGEVNMKLFELKVLQLVSQKLLMRCPGVSWHEGQGAT